jgi:DNA adenine methylase
MSATPKIAKGHFRPVLKWAGGKSQLLGQIVPKIPKDYARYIEPFFGGGALFFHLQPSSGIIADSNPELINLYKTIAENVNGVIGKLHDLKNNEKAFYEVRSQDWTKLSRVEAAARTVYLNKTCFNGLYRVNKNGMFNVPYGHYKNPKIADEETLITASELLGNVEIICGDYKHVLKDVARKNDFIFLDPPYLPISEYSDFKRYTKEQFYEEDHIELAEEVERLHSLGCHVVLTNSNHPLVHKLYGRYTIDVIKTKRYISSKGNNRTGEDVVVDIPSRHKFNLKAVPQPLPPQVLKYPPTRYMGSKNKLLEEIWAVASQFDFETMVDLFSGSGVVGYMFKSHGKKVYSNDYMCMSATFTKAMIENNHMRLDNADIEKLFKPQPTNDKFVESTFKGLYFTNEDNRLIDTVRANIKTFKNPYKRAIAMSALIRASFKKRPRGVFTYVGHRYDDGRKDLQKSFKEQIVQAVASINDSIFDNAKENYSRHGDAMEFNIKEKALVYIDPPYYSPLSDNEYVRRYHFVEGLARNWEGVEIQEHTATKKFKSYPTPFSSRKGAAEAFDLLFKRFKDCILLVSYSSNSLPTLDEMVSLIAAYKSNVEVIPVDHKYSFGNQGHKIRDNKNTVKEYLFVGF